MNIRMKKAIISQWKILRSFSFLLFYFLNPYDIDTFGNFASSHKNHLYNIKTIDFKRNL